MSESDGDILLGIGGLGHLIIGGKIMIFKFYVNNIYHGIVESGLSTDDRTMIHVPEELNQAIGNKYFHIDLVEAKE